jgi:hypothetical protein
MNKINDLKNLRKSESRESAMRSKNGDNPNLINIEVTRVLIFKDEEEGIHSEGNDIAMKNTSQSKVNRTVSSRIEIDASADEKAKNDKDVFITQNKKYDFFDNKDYYTFHDLIVPGGKNAKLVSDVS